jgi:hypothetical protein
MDERPPFPDIGLSRDISRNICSAKLHPRYTPGGCTERIEGVKGAPRRHPSMRTSVNLPDETIATVRDRAAADQVRRLVDEAPGLSDYETTIDGRLVRVCGVDLVEREGPFRPAVQVLADALARLDHLRSEDAPAACIARLEALVSETVERL